LILSTGLFGLFLDDQGPHT